MTPNLPRIHITEEHLDAYRSSMNGKEASCLPSLNDVVHGIADFSQYPAQRPNLAGFNLEGADFSLCHLEHACFDHALLSHACFASAHLKHCSFRQAMGEYVNWNYAVLAESQYEQAQLERNYFEGASLIRSSFRGANLRYGQFAKAWVKDCTLEDATVTFTLFDPAWVLEHIHPRTMHVSFTNDRESIHRTLRTFSSHF